MRKGLLISLLLFGFAGIQYLTAQAESADRDSSRDLAPDSEMAYEEDWFSLTIKPYVDHDFDLNLNKLEKDAAGNAQDAFHQGDGFGGAELLFGYGDFFDFMLDIRYNIGNQNDFDEILKQTYVGVHALDALFGVDQKVFDAYIKAGLFDAEFDNAKYAGTDAWLADVDSLKFHQGITDWKGILRNRLVPNLQLSLKILDMLTLSGVFRLDDWQNIPFKGEHAKAGTTFADLTVSHNLVTDPQVIYDFGVALLFEETFADAHKIEASVGYLADFSSEKDILGVSVPESTFDQLGITLAYTGTFGNIQLMPFANFRMKDVLAKADASLDGITYDWSAGVSFGLLGGENNSVKLLGVGIDVAGNGSSKAGLEEGPSGQPPYAILKGLGVRLSTDALRTIMGENFLAPYAQVRMEFNSNDVVKRTSSLELIEIGLNQYLINDGTNMLSLLLGYQLESVDNTTGGLVLADKVEHSIMVGVDMNLNFDVSLR